MVAGGFTCASAVKKKHYKRERVLPLFAMFSIFDLFTEFSYFAIHSPLFSPPEGGGKRNFFLCAFTVHNQKTHPPPPTPRAAGPLTDVDMDAHNDTKGKVFVSLCGKVTHNLRHSAILSGPAIDLCCQGCLGPSGNINILSRKIGKKLNWKMGRN